MTLSAVRAKTILRRFSRQRILVVGDLMLDCYIYGGVSRISPEAPVPIIHVTHEKSMPGGASNVAWNVQSLGARAAVSGILGKDATGRDLKKMARWRSMASGQLSKRVSLRIASRWSAWTGRTISIWRAKRPKISAGGWLPR
jgi:bifunctional ADP-heptose synthase (sugar kinase/adenylyltransferase)